MLIENPCASCQAQLDTWMTGNPDKAGRLDWHCSHNGVAVSLRIAGGKVSAWTAWSCFSADEFHRNLAFRAGGEEGIRATLEAEAAIAKAGGATN